MQATSAIFENLTGRNESRPTAGALQWVELAPGLVIVADDRQSWLHGPSGFSTGDPFDEEMTGEASLESTRNLLEGALAVGIRRAQALAMMTMPEKRPALTVARWLWQLAANYRTTHATPPTMQAAAERFREAGRRDLEAYALEKVKDEAGHDKLAMADIKGLGYPPEKIIDLFRPPHALAAVDYFKAAVRGEHPVCCVGYAYALERMAATRGQEAIDRVEAALPPGVRATRCLRVHSAIGHDQDHVEDAIRITAAQPAGDRIRIARAAFETITILRSVHPDGNPTNEDLEARLGMAGL